MKRINAAFLVTFSFLLALPASAQVRTFVSSSGLDTNPCTLTAPCRNFGPAVNAVAAGGEVVALDTAGYGAVTINKAVTLLAAPGIHAAIAPTTYAAIDIYNAPMVVIRGLFLKSHGATLGIFVRNATAHIEAVRASGFSWGLSSDNNAVLSVLDSTFSENVQGASFLHSVAAISGTHFENNSSTGLQAYRNSKVSCVDCVSSGNQVGFSASGAYNEFTKMTLERCTVANNSLFGIYADDGAGNSGGPSSLAEIWVSNSTSTNNQYGLAFNNSLANCTNCAKIFTRGNNTVEGNTVLNGTFTASFPAK